MSLDAKTQEEAIAFAEERFRVDVQHAIQTVLNYNGLTRREFAQRLGMSEAQLSQLFSSRANPTVRTIARVFHAADDECFISSNLLKARQGKREKICWITLTQPSDWHAARAAKGAGVQAPLRPSKASTTYTFKTTTFSKKRINHDWEALAHAKTYARAVGE